MQLEDYQTTKNTRTTEEYGSIFYVFYMSKETRQRARLIILTEQVVPRQLAGSQVDGIAGR